MNKHQRAKVATIRCLTAVLAIFFGILFSAQWRSLPTRVVNPIAPYASLKESREALYTEQNQLKDEIKSLQQEIEKIQKEGGSVNLSKEELARLEQKKSAAGLTKLTGPGLIVTYDDSKSEVANEDSIVHAADLRDTVNLLWSSGAEAIAINNQRIVINTAIDCIVNTILINDVKISNPFKIEAIGDQALMYGRTSDPTLLDQIHSRKISQGLVFEIEKNDNITVPVFDGSFEIKPNNN